MESNFIKKPINGFVNIKESIPASFLDKKAPEVSPVKMSNLALKNGRTSLRRITGNDSQRAPRRCSAVQSGGPGGGGAVPGGPPPPPPPRSNMRLPADCREESAPPTEGTLSSLGRSSLRGPCWLAETDITVRLRVQHCQDLAP